MSKFKIWYYKHIKYRKQTKQGIGTLAEFGTPVTITRLTGLKVKLSNNKEVNNDETPSDT